MGRIREINKHLKKDNDKRDERLYISAREYIPGISKQEQQEYKKIKRDMNISLMIDYILNYTDTHKSSIVKMIRNKEHAEAAKKVVNIIGSMDEFVADDLLAILDNDEFVKFINLLDNKVLTNNEKFYDIRQKFRKITTIKDWDKSSEILSKLYKEKENYGIKDISEYYQKRDEHYKNEIKQGKFNFDEIAYSYFGLKMSKIKKLAEGKNFYNEFTTFDKLTDPNKQLEFIDKASKNPDYFINIKQEFKKESLNDFYDKLSVNTIKQNEIIKFDGQEFLFLIHAVKGMLKEDITNLILKDITNWDKNYERNSYISCSLINQEYIAYLGNNDLTLGFNNLKAGDIIAMNTSDIFFLKNHIITNLEDNASKYLTTEELIKNSYSMYNEVVLRRYRGHDAIMPDFLVAFDEINEITSKAAKDLNIPIHLIELDKYAKLLIEKLNYLKTHNELEYLRYLKRLSACCNLRDMPLDNYYKTIASSDAMKTDNEQAKEYIKKFK